MKIRQENIIKNGGKHISQRKHALLTQNVKTHFLNKCLRVKNINHSKIRMPCRNCIITQEYHGYVQNYPKGVKEIL